MSAISFKSISGITSITTPAGADNQFTLHNNNTTEAVKLDIAGNLHINNQLVVAGVKTFSDDVVVNFGTGNDLQIYHLPNADNIIDSNTTNLHIKHGTEYMAKFNADGAV